MKRRSLIRGVASSGLLAVGAGTAAAQVTDSPDGGPTHVKIRQDDGSYEVFPIEKLSERPGYVKPIPCDCDDCYCCSNCSCACATCYVCDDL